MKNKVNLRCITALGSVFWFQDKQKQIFLRWKVSPTFSANSTLKWVYKSILVKYILWLWRKVSKVKKKKKLTCSVFGLDLKTNYRKFHWKQEEWANATVIMFTSSGIPVFHEYPSHNIKWDFLFFFFRKPLWKNMSLWIVHVPQLNLLYVNFYQNPELCNIYIKSSSLGFFGTDPAFLLWWRTISYYNFPICSIFVKCSFAFGLIFPKNSGFFPLNDSV